MALLLAMLFGLVVWAGMLWAAIALIDRHNHRNKFVSALAWSGVNLVFALAMPMLGLYALVLVVAYLFLLYRVLTRYYELGVISSLLVIAILIAAPYFAMPMLLEWIGASEVRAIAVLLGLPGGILATWLVGRVRAKRSREDAQVPRARVVHVASPASPAARPAITPVQLVAPERVEPPLPSEGPRFLR